MQRKANGQGHIEKLGYKQFRHLGKREHQLVAEKALGKPLPKGCVVHHLTNNLCDNSGSNLVICQNQAYHLLIHQRERAFDACGHADYRKCPFCKEYDDPTSMIAMRSNTGTSYAHHACKLAYSRRYEERRRGLGR